MKFTLPHLKINNKEILPLIEGGKGISISNGITSGNWALEGGIGTVSVVNADSYDNDQGIKEQIYQGRTRTDRQRELINYAITGGITQIQIAHEISRGNGLININALWEMGGVEDVLHGILEKTKDLLHGVTCGAGMPYKLAEIAAKYNVFYYPIISSARAFKILYKRSFAKFKELLGAVVYEDPWLAGGHIGLSNAENPELPCSPYNRVKELRLVLTELGLATVPIIVAGGVWWLSEWQDWIDNQELGPIAFQFGSRPLLTKESPISEEWKQLLTKLKPQDIVMHKFSPTGFYSLAVRNNFIKTLSNRSFRQLEYSTTLNEEFNTQFQEYFLRSMDIHLANGWAQAGFSEVRTTPDKTIVFLKTEEAKKILKDQLQCSGCLSSCKFSGWSQTGQHITPDVRSFCIQKTLQDVAHNGSVDDNLVFCGKIAARFAEDPFYFNGFIPSIKELIARILTGF